MRRLLLAMCALGAACGTGTLDPGAQDGSPAADATSVRDGTQAIDAAGAPDADLRPDAAWGSLAAPVVDGEPSAGHARPSFTWSTPDGATSFRHRLDGGSWTEVALAVTLYTPEIDLGPGAHTLEVQALGADGWSPPGSFTTTITYYTKPGFWNGVARELAQTPHGHLDALSAHNCYAGTLATPAENLAATLAKVHAAQAAGADLIELDIKDQAGVIRIDHEDAGSAKGAPLADVLADPGFRAGDQVPFIEIKENAPTDAAVRAILDVLLAERASYARNGRPVVLRTFQSIGANLELTQAALEDDRYVFIRPYVRLSVLYGLNQTSGAATGQALVQAASTAGYQMVEFNYQESNLFPKLVLARALGLGVNLWTVPTTNGEVFIASTRQEIDAITSDYDLAKARQVIADPNAIFHLDAWDLGAGATAVPYLQDGTATFTASAGAAGEPEVVVRPEGNPLYGGALSFASASSERLTLIDADAPAGAGVLVAAVVRFANLALADGTTAAILSKANSGGFALELANPGGTTATVLRFGVHVNGGYVYATYPAASLNTTDSFFLTAAYDGDGGVWLWVNNSPSGVTNGGPVTGGVTSDDVPILIGADPEAAGQSRYYFDGEVQLALVQAWSGH